uniref:Uncharacterized protein n=1 Tax=Opuntia streptacantha TaxID=393608 RepID=A0A7C9DKC7_OPUST
MREVQESCGKTWHFSRLCLSIDLTTHKRLYNHLLYSATEDLQDCIIVSFLHKMREDEEDDKSPLSLYVVHCLFFSTAKPLIQFYIVFLTSYSFNSKLFASLT